MRGHAWVNALIFGLAWTVVAGVALNLYSIWPNLQAQHVWYTSIWFLYALLAVALVGAQLRVRSARPTFSYGQALAEGVRVSLISAIGMGGVILGMNGMADGVAGMRDISSVATGVILLAVTFAIGLLESLLISALVMKRR